MDLKYFLFQAWELIIRHGIPLAALLVLAILLPRAGRLLIRILTRKLEEGEESTKASLALVGALVYVLQAVGYFAIIMLALTNVGVPPMGAAIPATVVSAAVGFGAQSVIGDFLAGFFIISERQFGMGDYVSFDGTSNAVEGTVVSLTLRATKIRTPSGEVVTVPNGSAGVITNFSQEWSRAVVDMQIPLLPGETMKDLNSAVERATRAALRDKSIRRDITGEVDILPAISLTAPTVAGQPWTVTTRINVEVNPARQWAVERVIRAALLNTFWSRYEQSSPLTAAQDVSSGVSGNISSNSTDNPAGFPTEILDATSVNSHSQSKNDATPARDKSSTNDPTAGLAAVAHSGSEDGLNGGPGKPAYPDEDALVARATEKAANGEKPTEGEKIQETLSVGGRVRASTTVLLVILLILGTLALFSANPDGADAGFLNPERWKTASSASSETTQSTEEASAPAATTSQSTVDTEETSADTATSETGAAGATNSTAATTANNGGQGNGSSITTATNGGSGDQNQGSAAQTTGTSGEQAGSTTENQTGSIATEPTSTD